MDDEKIISFGSLKKESKTDSDKPRDVPVVKEPPKVESKTNPIIAFAESFGLKVFETTPSQIAAWQMWSHHYYLRRWLFEHDHEYYDNFSDYREFRLGYDKLEHRAIFALDDTHFVAINFDNNEQLPVNRSLANLTILMLRQSPLWQG